MIDPPALQRIADRCLPGHSSPSVEAVGHGGTTPVYRATRGQACVFIRLAETPSDDMSIEAALHEELRRRGVSVPSVVSLEPPQEGLDRGALALTAMPGVALVKASADAATLQRAAVALGKDLGRMARIPVDGFGFLSAGAPAFAGELATASQLLVDPAIRGLERSAGALPRALQRDLSAVIAIASQELDDAPSELSHGDMDATHAFVANGRYAGIIDLGEAQGAPPLLDLASWAVHKNQLDVDTLSGVVEGYAEYATLPPDARRRIGMLGALLALGLMNRVIGRGKHEYEALLLEAMPSVAGMALE